MKAVVAAFNQEKALVGAFSVITNLRMELFQALVHNIYCIFYHFPHSGIFQEPESAQPGSGAAGQPAAGQHAAPRQQGGGAGAGVGGVNKNPPLILLAFA